MDNDRALAFLGKAEESLDWCDKHLLEMRQHGQQGKISDVERSFVALLTLIDSIHQALVDAAKKLDLTDWRDELNQIREEDPLLRYVWKARNSKTHDALVIWRPSMKHLELRVLDPIKAWLVVPKKMDTREAISAMWCYLYGVNTQNELIEAFKANPIVSQEKQNRAGVAVQIPRDSLSLDDFTLGRGKKAERLSAPDSHLGATLPSSADQAAFFCIKFYRDKLRELSSKL